MPRVYEIIMGMCLSIVNRAVKRLLVEGEWTEGGNWKWSQLFPFPQSVYGNAFGARFSSHGGGGGKDSGRESKTERKDIKRKQRQRERLAEVPFLSIFHGEEPAPCVSFIVWLYLWQVAQKPPLIYPEHLVLLRKKKRTKKAGNHSMCQSDMAFPLLTLQTCWVHSAQSPQ